MFDLMSQTCVAAFGETCTYTRDGVSEEFNILIERNLEIIDDQTGAAQYINAAVWANADFPHEKPLDGDTIIDGAKTWKVLRKVSDDGFVSTVEIR